MAKITYYGYSTFIIQGERYKIAIDPGIALPNPDSIIPESEWPGTDMILLTNNNQDHAAKAHEMMEATKAILVAHEELREELEKDFAFTGLTPGNDFVLSEVRIRAISSTYGSTGGGILGFLKKEQAAAGCIGFIIELDERVFCHLGDSILREDWDDWRPDVLLVPIGRLTTMTPEEALDAVELIKPRVILPMHYNLPYGPFKNSVIDPMEFKRVLDERGYDCRVLQAGESLVV